MQPNSEKFSAELAALIEEQRQESLLENAVMPSTDHDQLTVQFPGVKLVVCSAVEAMEFVSEEPWACISIASEEGAWPELSEEHRIALLQLRFHDVECRVESGSGRSFSRADARKVLDFVLEHCLSASTLLIHCERGESRSAGIAAAIAHLFGKDRHDFEQDGLRPNRLVYRLISDLMPPLEPDHDHAQRPDVGLYDEERECDEWS